MSISGWTWIRVLHICTCTISDLICENEFLQAILYQRQSPRCLMWWKVHFELNISTIVCMFIQDWSRQSVYKSSLIIVFWKLVLMYKWNFVSSAIFIYLLSFMYKTVFRSIYFHNAVTRVMLLNIYMYDMYMINCCTIPPVVHNLHSQVRNLFSH